MATLRQITANRLNALKSTGPVTEVGKLESRRGAVKHGLAGAGIALPDEQEALVKDRLEQWRKEYLLTSPRDEWLLKQLVVNSVRIEVCQQEETAIRNDDITRASLCWDNNRRLAVEEVAAGLSKRPALVSRRLMCSKQGCEWLLVRWFTLGEVLRDRGEWSVADKALAVDLLGTPPEFRDRPLEDTPAALVEREVALLERRLVEALDDLDDRERAAAEMGLDLDESKALARRRRYEAACLRRFMWASKLLEKNRREPLPVSIPPAPQPVPTKNADLPNPEKLEAMQTLLVQIERETEARIAANTASPPTTETPATQPARRMNRKARRAALKLAKQRL
jgi:hypothetical protein